VKSADKKNSVYRGKIPQKIARKNGSCSGGEIARLGG
jgi:hypothetical protein